MKVLKNPVTNMNKGFGFVKLPNRDALIRLLLTSKPVSYCGYNFLFLIIWDSFSEYDYYYRCFVEGSSELI